MLNFLLGQWLADGCYLVCEIPPRNPRHLPEGKAQILSGLSAPNIYLGGKVTGWGRR